MSTKKTYKYDNRVRTSEGVKIFHQSYLDGMMTKEGLLNLTQKIYGQFGLVLLYEKLGETATGREVTNESTNIG